ncbi:uncharacterized protein EAF01_005756 [Botrytis porri]|uniref:Uncharacterized protein n=1 Tax=Botrytis porri TaxID=87229 RepID=A0A4Z1KG68_9HELO|nr:uncharacterized protein EAF01_005756 [Botrytis porri]KAF7905235.1 hypothetical protein EAF01_005756 [Botrytis porri]TGO85037.1 hypothetical protein BPOR_0438g00080 [Botrytis porri]
MTTQSRKDPLRRGTPPNERREHLSKSPNFPTSSSRHDRIALKRKVWEDKRRDYEKKYGSRISQKLPSSESLGQDSPNKKLRNGSDQGWGKLNESPTDPSEGEGVHWLDALEAENLSRTEFTDRIKKRLAQPDPYFEYRKRKNAESDVMMQRHKEIAAVILKKKEELSAWRLTGKPPRRVGRVGDRNTSEDEYQRAERERSARRREYAETSQLIDWDEVKVWNADEAKLKGYEDMEDWWNLTHKESQDPVIKAASQKEPTKPSDSGKSKGYEDVEGWWKPFQRAPRESVTTTVKDPARVKSAVTSARWGEGPGGGGKHIQRLTGGHLPFQNEPESPLKAAERLENQLDANEEYKYRYKNPSVKKVPEPLNINEEYKYKYKSSSAKMIRKPLEANKQEQVKKSSPIEEAFRNSPLSYFHYFKNDRAAADVSWKEILILVVTGMLVAELGLTIAGVSSDKQEISGSSKWGLGKTVE